MVGLQTPSVGAVMPWALGPTACMAADPGEQVCKPARFGDKPERLGLETTRLGSVKPPKGSRPT